MEPDVETAVRGCTEVHVLFFFISGKLLLVADVFVTEGVAFSFLRIHGLWLVSLHTEGNLTGDARVPNECLNESSGFVKSCSSCVTVYLSPPGRRCQAMTQS